MDESKRESLKRNVVDQVEKVVDNHRPFETVIDIYVDMLLQKENLENRIKDNKNNLILTQALQELNNDIMEYKEQLMI